MKRMPYSIRKLLIPVLLLFYLSVITVADTFKSGEITPFFDWSLFSWSPPWEMPGDAVLIAHEIGGAPVDDRILIPSNKIMHKKILLSVVRKCRKQADTCDDNVQNKVYPVVKNITRSNDVEFSIFSAKINLRLLREDIRSNVKLRAQDAQKYHIQKSLVGRWNTIANKVSE